MAEAPRRKRSAGGNPPKKGYQGKGRDGRGGGSGDGRSGGGPGAPRGGSQRNRRDPRAPRLEDEAPKSWGGVARRGAGQIRNDNRPTASDAWREAVQAALPAEQQTTTQWIRVDDDAQVRDAAAGA